MANDYVDKSQYVSAWNEEDDNLLKTLYVERNCPVEIIASVFHQDESFIEKRIKELELLHDA